MVIEIDYVNIPNPKVKIYAETAKHILNECFVRAKNIKAKEKNAAKYARVNGDEYVLQAVLNSLIKNQPITAKFLRTKVKEVAQLTNGVSYQTIGFDHIYIFTLAVFAGVDDYVKFDATFGPVTSMQVVFIHQPFSLFKLIRLPLCGYLSDTGEKWELVTGDGNKLSGAETKNAIYTMPGDRHPFWIQIIYQADGQSRTLYLAQAHNSRIIPAQDSKLKAFFDRFTLIS